MDRARKQDQSILHAVALLISLCLLTSNIMAQNAMVNGALHGTLTDATGAVVPDATVKVLDLASGQNRVATTDSRGFYTITQLPPVRYSIAVSKEGFATVTQTIELLVNQDLEANYTLKLGSVSQEVTVESAPPMLQTTSGTLSTVVQGHQVVDLPLNGRQYTQLILLTPGAAPKESRLETGQIPVGGAIISPSTNGQQGVQNSFMLDGVLTSQSFGGGSSVNPPPDAIQEFNVQAHMSDAEYAISAGSNVNVVTKSGGPTFHGDVWEFVRNSALDAAGFFADYTHQPKPPFTQNQYGATIGGPVLLPGYNGRDKHTYFFGYWEGFGSTQGFTEFANVPTSAEEGGNFSDILTSTQATSSSGQPLFDNLGRPIIKGQIYNPYSGRQVTAGSTDPVTGKAATTTGIVRDPIPGNIIPPGMLIPQASPYLKAFYPAPNYGPGGNSFPNFVTASNQIISAQQFGVGLNHTFKNNDSLEGKFYFTNPNRTQPNALLLGTSIGQNHARAASVGYTHLFTPTLLASIHYGYTWYNAPSYTTPGGQSLIDATNQGAILDNENGFPLVPYVTIGPRLTGTSQSDAPIGPFRTHEITGDIQKVHGANTFGIGLLYMHIHDQDNAWQTIYSFDQYPTSAITGASTNVTTTGDGLASMLLNLPTALTTFFGVTGADISSNWIGAYIQDKWQVTKNLSVQLGTRWDFESPPHYKNNEFSMWNVNCPIGSSATEQQIEEQCLLMPIPYVIEPTASNPNPLSWPVPNARSTLFEPQYNGWQPRFGFAYTLGRRTVVRGGFGIFDDHTFYDADSQDTRSSWPFGGEAELSALNNGIITPSNITFNNPPAWQSFLPPQTNHVVIARAGQPNSKIPYAMEFNFGVEEQISTNTALTVNYVGSQDRHLWGDILYNQALPSAMGPNAVPNGLPFPFIGGGIQGDVNAFPGNYNALQAKLERRVSAGLAFLASYTYSKCMDEYSGGYDDLPDNTYNLRGDYGVCDYDFPHILSVNYVYQLPFGRGKHFLGNTNRAADALIGGWNLAGIVSAYSGSPFNVWINFDNANVGRTANVYPERANIIPGCDLKPSGFQQNVQHWYNPACFAVPAPYTFGNTHRDFLRGPDSWDYDFSAFKDFHFTELKFLEFRGEIFNILNHTNLSPPGGNPIGPYGALGGIVGTYVGTPTFMQITSSSAGREVQLSGKFTF
jgi:Carboxypeptidase regulatory-like domain